MMFSIWVKFPRQENTENQDMDGPLAAEGGDDMHDMDDMVFEPEQDTELRGIDDTTDSLDTMPSAKDSVTGDMHEPLTGTPSADDTQYYGMPTTPPAETEPMTPKPKNSAKPKRTRAARKTCDKPRAKAKQAPKAKAKSHARGTVDTKPKGKAKQAAKPKAAAKATSRKPKDEVEKKMHSVLQLN